MMKTIKKLALVLAFSTLPVLGQNNSVSGTWKVSGDVMGYPIEQVCTFTQDGKKLTGSCKSAEASKPVEATGEVDDKKVTFKYNSEYNGEQLTITYTGTLDGSQLKGTIDVQPMSVSGAFTASKEEPKKE
ncbi:MAG TPA: hypothetical protein VEF04_09960 [Blastocatellia bacterium]|nr:hypothetical protein [Blastocatellia bacterium]